MIELIAQGNPIKIDGLGIFWPTVESTKEGITRAALLEGKAADAESLILGEGLPLGLFAAGHCGGASR